MTGGSAGATVAGSGGAAVGTAGSGGSNGGSSSTGGSSAGTSGGGAGGGGAGLGGAGGASAGAAGQGGASGSGGEGGAAGAGGGPGTMLPKRVLLYHFSTLNIGTVPAQITLLTNELKGWGYEVEESVDPSVFTTEKLAKFGGVGMINTCFEPFGANQMGMAQTTALAAFVEGGGGLFGTHCASVTFQSVEPPHPYNVLIGGRGGHGSFDGTSACRVLEQHVTTQMLAATFDFSGNLDNADYVAPDAKVLVKCQWSGGDKKDVAVSWYRTPGKGRVFYTNFAKIDADLSSETLGKGHILRGLSWILGRP
jgi:type 1 glutamine amidotransferase